MPEGLTAVVIALLVAPNSEEIGIPSSVAGSVTRARLRPRATAIEGQSAEPPTTGLLSRWIRGPMLLAVLVVWTLGAPAAGQEPEGEPTPETEPNYVRTSLEIGAVMGAGFGIYLYKGERNAYDWPLSWNRVEERFTTTNQFKFDDNEFAMNNVAHPVAGALYYQFARVNGFGPLGSSLFSLAGSTAWEVLVELREIVSLNDLIVTPATGIALGEALYQHQTFLRRSQPTRGRSVLEKVLGGPVLINRLFGEAAPGRATEVDARGFPLDRAHRFRAYGGPLYTVPGEATPTTNPETGNPIPPRAVGPTWMTVLGVTSEISSVNPRDNGGTHETGGLPVTRLEAHMALSDPRPMELHFGAETVLGGWRGGRIRATRNGRVGHRWIVGPSTAFTMRIDQVPGNQFLDLLAAAHILGLRGDAVVRHGLFRTRLTGAAFADFTSVRPLGYERRGGQGVQFGRGHSVLWWRRYYYGWGATLRGSAEVELGRLGVRYQIEHHTVDAIRGSHRKDYRGTPGPALRDTRTYGQGWLEFRGGDGWIVGAGLESWWGTGTMDAFRVADRETRLLLRVSATP